MEIIAKVSRGSKMDQIYVPKNRFGFDIGDYVVIRPLERRKAIQKLYFYGIKEIEPIKSELIKEIVGIIENSIKFYDNLIFTGSFLEEGFHFNDLDIIIVTESKINISGIKNEIERKTGIKAHILTLSNKELTYGLNTDPLYQMMLSKCVTRNRFVYKISHKLNYKLLDMHLLKSKTLIDNFDILSGREKYDLARNLIAIHLYLDKEKVSKEIVDNFIKKTFGLNDIEELKQNIIDKKAFLKRYKLLYDRTFAKILRGIKDGAK